MALENSRAPLLIKVSKIIKLYIVVVAHSKSIFVDEAQIIMQAGCSTHLIAIMIKAE